MDPRDMNRENDEAEKRYQKRLHFFGLLLTFFVCFVNVWHFTEESYDVFSNGNFYEDGIFKPMIAGYCGMWGLGFCMSIPSFCKKTGQETIKTLQWLISAIVCAGGLVTIVVIAIKHWSIHETGLIGLWLLCLVETVRTGIECFHHTTEGVYRKIVNGVATLETTNGSPYQRMSVPRQNFYSHQN